MIGHFDAGNAFTQFVHRPRGISPECRILAHFANRADVIMTLVHCREQLADFFRRVLQIGVEGDNTRVNAGLRYFSEKGDFDAYWLLNNDTEIEAGALTELRKQSALQKGQGLFSPVIRTSPQGKIWFAGGNINFFRMRTTHNDHFEGMSRYKTDFLTGCALFIPKEALMTLGMLDERYFLYAEDAEYSLRATRKGIPLFVVPESTVYHSEQSEENEEKLYWLVRSSAEFYLRESRGVVWPVVRVYYALRRVKNWFRLRYFPNHLAREIERAYTDVSL